MRRKAMYDVTDPYDINISGENWQQVSIEVEVTEHHDEACTLGPDGFPLMYAPRAPVGFDLRVRRKGRAVDATLAPS